VKISIDDLWRMELRESKHTRCSTDEGRSSRDEGRACVDDDIECAARPNISSGCTFAFVKCKYIFGTKSTHNEKDIAIQETAAVISSQIA
jgi:hypothetical protein